LFEFGDAAVIRIVREVSLEQRVETLEGGGFPIPEELGFEVVFATEFGLASRTGQQL
jgi:hypothetical protein